jgi:hypothetical protein
MLREAVERCPDAEWLRGDHKNAFWQVAYHVLFFTHLYLQQNETAFVLWSQHHGADDGTRGGTVLEGAGPRWELGFRHRRLPRTSGRTWRMSAPHTRAKPKRGAPTATTIAVAKIARTTTHRRLATFVTHGVLPGIAGTGNREQCLRVESLFPVPRSRSRSRFPVPGLSISARRHRRLPRQLRVRRHRPRERIIGRHRRCPSAQRVTL